MDAKAPAVIKLFGEHAVVYGRTAVAMAIDLYATARTSESEGFVISLPDIGKEARLSEYDIRQMYFAYQDRRGLGSFAAAQELEPAILPFAVITSMLWAYHRVDMNCRVSVTSAIPIQKGLASSAACSVAFLSALAAHNGIEMPDREFAETARLGEKIQHLNDNAGRIDVAASYLGGVVRYSNGTAEKVPVSEPISLLLVDTGPKRKTSKMVDKVARLHHARREAAERIFDEIEGYCTAGINDLAGNSPGRLGRIGNLMLLNHDSLRKLGVSSARLDRAVDIAKEQRACGAKLSGGGGGGMAIVLPNGPQGVLRRALEDEGFSVSEVRTSIDGAKDGTFRKSKSR